MIVEATSLEEAEAMTLASHPTPAADSGWDEDSSWVISFTSPPTDTQVNDAWEM
ncbi:MAG: hypothetical protein G8345_17375 [Magnetococcales bacterium]|nr:hypothetical protein [Magnetococcales bacterium]